MVGRSVESSESDWCVLASSRVVRSVGDVRDEGAMRAESNNAAQLVTAGERAALSLESL